MASWIIAIANQKGGVGKTTTTINLATEIQGRGSRVLLIDLDPQGNATTGSGVDKKTVTSSVYDVLANGIGIADVRVKSGSGHYDVLPANQDLAGAEVELVEVQNRDQRLKQALTAVHDEYDYVLVDCPPALSLLTLNGLAAARSVMIPMQCEYYALEGLSDLVNTIKRVKLRLNPQLEIGGLVRTMFDGRNSLTNQVSEQLLHHFGAKVFETVIPRNVRVAEAPSFGMPVTVYDKLSKGAEAYRALTDEFLLRFEKG